MVEARNSEPRLSRYIHAKAARYGYPCAASFELTPRCNFNCKMCYIHLSLEEQQRRGRELSAQEWISLGEQACSAGMVFLLLTGGEPTIRPDFPEIYLALKKMGLMISVNTNGVLIRGELLELFRQEPPYRMNISLYGMSNETYERVCGVPAYDSVMENIRALRNTGIDVKLNMSVTAANSEDLRAVFEQAKQLGVHTQAASYMFPPVRTTGEFGAGFRMPPEDAAKCEVAYDLLRMGNEHFCAHAKRLIAGQSAPDDGSDDCAGTPGGKMRCRAGNSSFWITWDGQMLPCGMMPQPSANVLELGVQNAWREIHDQAAKIRLPKQCDTCQYSNGCHVCAAICYCETGRFDVQPEYVCSMTRSIFSQTRKILEENEV